MSPAKTVLFMCSLWDSNPHCDDFKSSASAIGLKERDPSEWPDSLVEARQEPGNFLLFRRLRRVSLELNSRTLRGRNGNDVATK